MGKNISKIYRKTKNWIPHATRHFLGSSRSLFALKQNKKKKSPQSPGFCAACLPVGKKRLCQPRTLQVWPPPNLFESFSEKASFFVIFWTKNRLHNKRKSGITKLFAKRRRGHRAVVSGFGGRQKQRPPCVRAGLFFFLWDFVFFCSRSDSERLPP